MNPIGRDAPLHRHEVARLCDRLPIFPLPRVVLMPRASLPLHVFEPRYRALVRRCLDGPGLMGIATLRPGYEADYYGAPAIWPEIGIGRLVAYEGLPEGRSNVLLESVGRGTVVEELPTSEPFREVRCVLRDDDDAGAELAVTRVRALVLQLVPSSNASREESEKFVRLPPRRMIDELALRLFDGPDDQRAYLATDPLALCADRVAERLAALVRPSGPAADA